MRAHERARSADAKVGGIGFDPTEIYAGHLALTHHLRPDERTRLASSYPNRRRSGARWKTFWQKPVGDELYTIPPRESESCTDSPLGTSFSPTNRNGAVNSGARNDVMGQDRQNLK
jgi:hypothetical protein